MKTALISAAFATALVTTVSAVNLSLTNVSGGAVSSGTYTVGTNTGTANANSWPNAEGPAFATNGLQTDKYLNFLKIDTGIAVNANGGSASLILNGLTFSAGNDAPERDPLTFTLYGSSTPLASGPIVLSTLTLIVANAATGLATDPGRNTFSSLQTFANNTAYAGYVLYFPTVRNAAGANSMQVGEITFSNNIPEPGTVALSGLAFLGFLRRRR